MAARTLGIVLSSAEEFARHREAAQASDAPGCWVQRYGYLSDEKLGILREIWSGRSRFGEWFVASCLRPNTRPRSEA